MKRFRFLSIALSLMVLLASGTVSHSQAVGGVPTPCTQTAILNSVTASGATQLIAAPTGPGVPTYINGFQSTAATVGNTQGPRIHICSVQYRVNQTTTAANYGLIAAPGTGVLSGTYTSGITATGSSTQTCKLTFSNNGIVNGTATVALTGTNTIAGSTALVILTSGYGATAAPTTATVSSGTATCSGTATVSTTISPCAAPAGISNATALTPLWVGTVSVVQNEIAVYTSSAPLTVPALNAVCLDLSAAPTGAQVMATYAVY